MKTITISKTKPFTGKLAVGQLINIKVGKGLYSYKVEQAGHKNGVYLNGIGMGNNAALVALGLSDESGTSTLEGVKLFIRCCVGGMTGQSGIWPFGTLAAQQKLLRQLFPTKQDLAREAKAGQREAKAKSLAEAVMARKLAALSPAAARLIKHLNGDARQAFGCQRQAVIQCFCVLLDEDLTSFIRFP